jgi:hypothetical protein
MKVIHDDRTPVGWAELAKPNIMIILAKTPNVGQRYAFAQPTKLGSRSGTI